MDSAVICEITKTARIHLTSKVNVVNVHIVYVEKVFDR